MKLWLLSLFALLLFSFSIERNNENEDLKNMIVWKKDYKLKYTDFKIVNYKPMGSTAITQSGIWFKFDTSRICGYKAFAVFDKDGSYWYNGSMISNKEYILNHEQLHFDISQYIASLMDKELSVMDRQFKQGELDRFYKSYNLKLDSMQRWYDLTTDHSRDSLEQVSCNHYIDSLVRR